MQKLGHQKKCQVQKSVKMQRVHLLFLCRGTFGNANRIKKY